MGRFDSQTSMLKSGDEIVLRSAVLSDAQRINQLAINVFETSEYLITTPEEFRSVTEGQQCERIQKFHDNEGDLLLIVECAGEPIGMLDFQCGIKKRIAHRGYMGMSVHSSWRGKGVGKVLLSGLIDWVRVHPTVEVISLKVIEVNEPAVALYSKLGFESIGRDPFGVKLSNDHFLSELSMSLRVLGS